MGDTAKRLETLFDERQVSAAVARIAGEIKRDFGDSEPLLIGVLKGAYIFLADLVRALDLPSQVDFVRISTYGDAQSPTRAPIIAKDIEIDIAGRDVIVVEDIVDTGRSISHLMAELTARKPKSLSLATLLDKYERREVEVRIDYTGFVIPDGFVVGYGIDFAEEYRNLREICVLKG